MLDLDGITVVAMEQAVAAPYASGKLAQAGARVIKIERPEGDFARRYDTLVNGESCLLYTSPSPRDKRQSRMPSSA